MKVILFGATGMVGQGVLRECLRDDGVEGVLAAGRSSTGLTHPKLRELILKDLFDFTEADADLQGYDACFFCLGVSFRLGALRAMHGEVSKTRWTRIAYSVFRPLLPMIWAIAPGAVISTEELGRAMIRVARQGAPKRVLENRDLRALGAP